MGYQYGRTLTRAQLLDQLRREVEEDRRARRVLDREKRRTEAEERLKETIRAVRALNIPPDPDGYRHRVELDRELTIYHKTKQQKATSK